MLPGPGATYFGEAVGRELRRLGVVAASRAADVTLRVTGLRVVF